jgi:hypothetical protein
MAVQNAQARCRSSETPFACLAEFLAKLEELKWDAETIREIELVVLKSLTAQPSVQTKVSTNADQSALAAAKMTPGQAGVVGTHGPKS